MTVIQAMTLAGGLPRSHALDVHQIERDIIGWTGDLHELAAQRTALLAKKARLTAELNHQDHITFPDSIAKNANKTASEAMAQERLFFETRRDGLNESAAILQETINYLTNDVSLIKAQMKKQQEFLDITVQEQKMVNEHRSLITQQNYFSAQRDHAAAENDSLKLEDELTMTLAKLQENKNSLAHLNAQFKEDALNDLNSANQTLAQIEYKISTERTMIAESDKLAPLWASARLSFSIIRRQGAQFSEEPATETTLVDPGDTIKVKCCGQDSVESIEKHSVDADGGTANE